MYYMTVTENPTTPTVDEPPMPASDREHLFTVVCGLWMTVGLFLDGYFHQNLDEPSESFLTPWHAVFYAGFTASALWIASTSWRRDGGTFDWRLRFLPPGYDGARIGIGLFAAGGVGDAAWHTAFGVERGVDALLSPTHLLLSAGLVLILTTPYRAASAAPLSPPRPWMVAGSIISATALVGFFLNFVWGLGIAAFTRTAYDPASGVGETQVIAGVASMLVTTGVLFGSARLLVARRLPPPGALAVMFGLVSLLVSAAFEEDIEGVGAALLAGAVLDVAVRTSRTRTHAFFTAAVVLWAAYLGVLAIDGIEWQPEIWIGAIVLNALTASAISPATKGLG